MAIIPVTPVDREKLVPVTTAVIIDFDGTSPSEVRANGVVIFDGVTGVGGWISSKVTKPGGTRLVLDFVAGFDVGDVVRIQASSSDGESLVYVFQVSLRQLTTTDDTSVPRITETSSRPWIAYSREPGNIYARKDSPVSAEILLVPGDKVDVGFNEETDEIEILYVQNGKVFITTGDKDEDPSTLAVPSVLKDPILFGDLGSNPVTDIVMETFTPVKRAATDNLNFGTIGSQVFHVMVTPAIYPNVYIFIRTETSVTVIITPSLTDDVDYIEIWKSRGMSKTLIATAPVSKSNTSSIIDNNFISGDTYSSRYVFKRSRGKLSDFSRLEKEGPGDIVEIAHLNGNESFTFDLETFTPLKYASPSDPCVVNDVIGGSGQSSFDKTWFSPTDTTASLAAAIGGHMVVSGLFGVSRAHRGLVLVLSSCTTPANNGSWEIVEVIDEGTVRVKSPLAPGLDANNGSIGWAYAAPGQLLKRLSMITLLNTQDIGVG